MGRSGPPEVSNTTDAMGELGTEVGGEDDGEDDGERAKKSKSVSNSSMGGDVWG